MNIFAGAVLLILFVALFVNNRDKNKPVVEPVVNNSILEKQELLQKVNKILESKKELMIHIRDSSTKEGRPKAQYAIVVINSLRKEIGELL